MQPHELEKPCNLSTKKSQATSPHKKITQSLNKQKHASSQQKKYPNCPEINHATSQTKKSCNLSNLKPTYLPTYLTTYVTLGTLMTIVTVVSSEKNHATSLQKKSRTLSTTKNHATFKKTSRETQNATLRTSHWLSNVSNCSSKKYWVIIKKGCVIFYCHCCQYFFFQ